MRAGNAQSPPHHSPRHMSLPSSLKRELIMPHLIVLPATLSLSLSFYSYPFPCLHYVSTLWSHHRCNYLVVMERGPVCQYSNTLPHMRLSFLGFLDSLLVSYTWLHSCISCLHKAFCYSARHALFTLQPLRQGEHYKTAKLSAAQTPNTLPGGNCSDPVSAKPEKHAWVFWPCPLFCIYASNLCTLDSLQIEVEPPFNP
jgi:hypothetical protein